MFRNFSGFFKDTGDLSMGRLMSFSGLVVSTVIACYGIVKGADLSGLAVLCTAFLVPSFGAKVIQSFSEKNNNEQA